MVLEPDILLTAYRRGIFPMAVDKRGRIGWFSPDPRAIIPLDDRFHVPHGLRRVLKRNKFAITVDTDFETVIRECAKRKEGTWISRGIIESYCNLHRLGHAHSIEVRLACHPESVEGSPSEPVEIPRQARNDEERKLVGGLYGVAIDGAFFGESMFHRVTDASKVALVALVERLRARGFVLLDTQWTTPHLRQFGTCEIPRNEYLRQLEQALRLECRF
ncbi:MAG TPA: leucyl/phenylalanyl-tRNA--protein transferase [Verrucomicrobiae bacterium]|nr:leucyl/phenylalanyl-tRNA--protein transferase [Verrucomicrobiae bacterium]